MDFHSPLTRYQDIFPLTNESIASILSLSNKALISTNFKKGSHHIISRILKNQYTVLLLTLFITIIIQYPAHGYPLKK